MSRGAHTGALAFIGVVGSFGLVMVGVVLAALWQHWRMVMMVNVVNGAQLTRMCRSRWCLCTSRVATWEAVCLGLVVSRDGLEWTRAWLVSSRMEKELGSCVG